MSSVWPTVALCAAYFYLVTVWGPRFMEKREAFQLRAPMFAYNLFQVAFNGWMFCELAVHGWSGYSFVCQPVDTSDGPSALRVVNALWWFYVSKFVDFVDTVLFVLRKKPGQMTVLHLVHHGAMPLLFWPVLRFTPGGQASFSALLNSLVHVVMYLYYFVAALGPRYRKYLGWKRYLTTFQMVQFVAITAHCLQLHFVEECDFPIAMCWWIAAVEILFFCLFLNFYIQAYVKKKGARKQQ